MQVLADFEMIVNDPFIDENELNLILGSYVKPGDLYNQHHLRIHLSEKEGIFADTTKITSVFADTTKIANY